jgi:hypothetical protein
MAANKCISVRARRSASGACSTERIGVNAASDKTYGVVTFRLMMGFCGSIG